MAKRGAEELRVVVSNEDYGTGLVAPDPRNCVVEISSATLLYPIGPYVRGSLKSNLGRLFGHREQIGAPSYVNAINNLDLTVQHGERVGIIGRNGSGKSTLLRAIGGIYPLKTGSIRVAGEIGALLDIGLGFESESTGRENIYYRGMAMGKSRRAIRDAEAEIIEFADLGSFIDLPMRTYSSGMWVRLGFAISTQFRPDVLLIDEVFGAGDGAFQERALQRMMRVVNEAGIVIVATHDLSLIERVCTRVIWLNRGEVVRDGPAAAVVPQFLDFIAGRLAI